MNKSFSSAVICIVFQVVLNQALLFSQDINIELSLQDSPDSYGPCLLICYSNVGNKDYYFPSLYWEDTMIPSFSSFLYDRPFQSLESGDLIRDAIEKGYFRNESYCLCLSFAQMYKQDWFLYLDNGEDEVEWHIINYFLSRYYESQRTGDLQSLLFFNKRKLKCKRYLRNSKFLVFLKKGETKTQMVSLRGIKEFGIILRIFVESDHAPSSLITGWMPEDVYHLPQRIGTYLLFDGQIRSNSITVDFSKDNNL